MSRFGQVTLERPEFSLWSNSRVGQEPRALAIMDN